MSFYPLLTGLAARILLGLAIFVWSVIALFDTAHASLRPGFGLAAVAAVISLVGLDRGWRWAPWLAAVALIGPIGLLAHHNGASSWIWLFWVFCIVATGRWLLDVKPRDRP